MITKQLNNYIGYGETEDEAEVSCKIISVMKSIHSIRDFEDLLKRREKLSPWKPTKSTLQISTVGYVKVADEYINNGNSKVKITNDLFEMLYKSFYDKLDMIDVAICSEEILDFFNNNNIKIMPIKDYPQVAPMTVFMEDESVSSYVILDKYNVVFFSNGKVAIKRLEEEMYWTCTFDSNKISTIDIMYYISYVRGYENMGDVIREVS